MIEWVQTYFQNLGLLYSTWLVLEWFLRIAAVFVVPRNRRPTAGLTWLTFIFLIPLAGWIVFIILGSSKLPRERRRIQKNLDYVLMRLRPNRSAEKLDVEAKYRHVSQLGRALSHMPVEKGNSYQILSNYHEIFRNIAADIAQAKKTVHLEYYTFVLDQETEPIFKAIEQARARNVTVRVLYDAYGTRRYFGPSRRMRRRLKACGVEVRSSLPLKLPFQGYTRPDLRNHRKLVSIDGQIGYSGSQNIIEQGYHRRDKIIYDELVTRVTGPIVTQYEAIFAADWFAETRQDIFESAIPEPIKSKSSYHKLQLLPSGPGFDDENNLKVFNSLIYAAEKSIMIVNPYFVPEESLITAIESAARRGVEVTMLNSRVMDQWMVGHAQRSYYEELMRSGVKIYWYNAPKLLHSKFIVVDEEVAAIGSSNLDIRSFELDHEMTLICYDEQIARELQVTAGRYLEHSQMVDKVKWLSRRRYKQLFDNIARLTSSIQ